jgi:hypothetical protein
MTVLPVLCVTLAWMFLPSGALAAETLSAPKGFTVVSRTELTPGVEHYELRREEPPLSVHVARVAADAPASLRAVLSNEAVAGAEGEPRQERTSSMCARVQCLVGLNGDFLNLDTQEPLGGLVTGGQLLRSPNPKHHQLNLTADGRLTTGGFEWWGKLVPTDLSPLAVDAVNVRGGGDRVILYTPAYAGTVPGANGVAIQFSTVEPVGPLRLGQTTMVELLNLVENPAEVPLPDNAGALIAFGSAGDALRDLWGRVQSGLAGSRALLRLETKDDVVESVGGSPILVRDGKRWFADVDDNFTKGRHPRSIVAWGEGGETLLVTVDGRQPKHSVGVSLAEAADLVIAMGATHAINLDGGGSTTFTVRSQVVNQPSDVAVKEGGKEVIRHAAESGDRVVGHVERPVASGLMVVPANSVDAPPVDPLAGPDLELPQALALPTVPVADPGSVPDGSVPALVTAAGPDFSNTLRVAAVAANVVVALGLGAVFTRRRSAGRVLPLTPLH